MTIRSRHGRLLAVFIFSLSAKGYSALRFLPGPFEVPQAFVEKSQTLWRDWERRWAKKDIPVDIQVEELPHSERQGLLGRTSHQTVQIFSEKVFPSLPTAFYHELAHVFLNHACMGQSLDRVVHELVALYLSGDFQRLVSNSITRRDLRTVDVFDPEGVVKTALFESYVAQFIHENHKSEKLHHYLESLFQSCGQPFFSKQSLRYKTAKLLGVSYKPAPSTSRVDFLMYDRMAKELLESEGSPDKAYPPASTMKPFLIVLDERFKRTTLSSRSNAWVCPEPEPVRMWSWQEALVKSCNGFFIKNATPHVERLPDVQAFFANLGIKRNIGSIYEFLNLESQAFKLSLAQIYKLYDWLAETQPTIVAALKKTPTEGTLKTCEGAAFFAREGYAIKTGTVRSTDGAPLHSWVVGIHEEYIFVAHAQGLSTCALLERVAPKLRLWPHRPLRTARVQILGLLVPKSFKISCASEGWPMLKTDVAHRKTLIKLSGTVTFEPFSTYQCLGGPFEISFKDNHGKAIVRKYHGRISVEPLDSASKLAPSDYPLTPKMARARHGSSLILTTSMAHYVSNVLLSEFSKGRKETLKALAFAVSRNMMNTERHRGRPICDTTHCQVFGLAGEVSRSFNKKIQVVVREFTRSDVLSTQTRNAWFPFYLGGQKPWSLKLSYDEIENRLGRPVRRISANGLRVVVAAPGGEQSDYVCEDIRNPLKLLSCPFRVRVDDGGMLFSGTGEGHGEGMDLLAADLLAAQGMPHDQIIKKYYQNININRL